MPGRQTSRPAGCRQTQQQRMFTGLLIPCRTYQYGVYRINKKYTPQRHFAVISRLHKSNKG